MRDVAGAFVPFLREPFAREVLDDRRRLTRMEIHLVEQVGASVRTKERWCFSVDSAAQDSSNEVTEEQTGYLGLAPI